MNALTRLDGIHRVDINRVLVLRTASNYSMQAPGGTAFDSLESPYPGGSQFANQSAWLCGSTVLHAILSHWDTAFGGNPILDAQITSAQQRQMPDNANGFKHRLFGILRTLKRVVRHHSAVWSGLMGLGWIAAIFMGFILRKRANGRS
jgi:hypothetical protein